ncbi:MAG: hypothetical protein NE328_04370 [Lentisphaeraceae bacterium]|nr:hypothetical protein [Lentisphaeraceae bacterium]
MNSDNQNIIYFIDRVRGTLAKRKLIFFSLISLSAGAALITLTGFTVPGLGLREDQFFSLFIALLIIPIVGLIFGIIKAVNSKLSRQQVAVKVEEAKPELMDAYACAVGIAEKGGPDGPIEEALTRQVKSKFQNGEITDIIVPGYLKQGIIFTATALTALLIWFALGSPLTKAALFHVRASGNPILAGVSVKPGNVSLPQGKDLRVEAEIKRGEEAASIEYNMGGKWQTLEMFNEGNGLFSAVIYGVEGNFQYKVVTPDVSSDEFSVNVFLEPQIKEFRLTVKPPSYMKRPDYSITEFKDLVVPENSTVEIELLTNKECKALIVEDNVPTPFASQFTEKHSYTFKALATHNYSINLNDSEGYSSISKPFKISIVKDMPPHIEITKPAKDLKKYKTDIVQLEINALDDFGLEKVSLHIEFSSDIKGKFINDKRVVEVFAAKGEKTLEKDLFHDINLKAEAAKEGDFISYYVTAIDNKEPIPQTSRSKIYFIEVRPDNSDVQKNEDEQEGEGEQQELSVDDLIALQKDLIRKTIEIRGRSPKVENEDSYELSDTDKEQLPTDTFTLRKKVKEKAEKILEEVKKSNGITEPVKDLDAELAEYMAPIGNYFNEAMAALKTAEEVLNNNALDEGMRLYNKSLHNFIKIAIELDKNKQKQKSKSKEPQEPQQQQDEEKQEDERLADMLEKLEELEEKQKDLNKELKKDDKEELAQEQMQKEMQEQKEKMEKLAEELEEMKQNDAAEQMQQAAQQQQQAAQQQQEGNSEGAQQDSQQAQKSLENASDEIKRAMRDKARQKLQQLSKKLDKTIEKQNDINDKTSGVEDPKSAEGKSELADLKKKQDEVQKEIQDVMDQLGAAANELDEKYPEVAEALRESREFASNQGIQRRLKRSSNALHYKRKEAAEREQQEAADSMNLLGHKVRDAINRLPQATLDELLKMRQQLEVTRRQVGASQGEGQSASQAAQISTGIGQMLQDMGERLRNDDLQNKLPEYLDAANKSGNLGAINLSQQKAVNQAAFILETMINQADLEKRLSLNKRTGAAPDKYRRSVREYLKSLSIEEK